MGFGVCGFFVFVFGWFLFVSKSVLNLSYFINCICMERIETLEEIFSFYVNKHQIVPVKPKS